MRRNVIFVIVFAAVVIGLIQLHNYSVENESGWKSISIDGLISLSYPDDIKERSDIPFELLVDREYKKILPEGADYESFRPGLIFLSRDFNEKDTAQLASFPNITVNAHAVESFDIEQLTDSMQYSILENIKVAIDRNLENTPYEIVEWKEFDSYRIEEGVVFRFYYLKEHETTQAQSSSITTYLFKNGREVEATLSAPGETINKWEGIYNGMISSIVFE